MSEVCDTIFSDFHRVCLLLVTVEWALDLSRVHLNLRKGTSTERVSADNTNLPALLHVVIGELGACRSLARALEADEHDNIRLATLELVGLVIAGEHVSELIDHSFLDDSAKVRG